MVDFGISLLIQPHFKNEIMLLCNPITLEGILLCKYPNLSQLVQKAKAAFLKTIFLSVFD